ncbi:winged helix-turn-helix transcriptional regulator [Streptomyces rubellomurinus]|uniref:winged helix-turn-helix transcriptional regulator n=1 Tax=Streptomyces rubellomurinus (strain ATCC 31215) TaxID=359131 RepID=UPI0024466A9B|nr:winged helix-turn-helix transcriptional regulator [Streptomyces rubellomurinus]
MPPHVEYELTDLGRSLREALQPLLVWGEAHLDEVDAGGASPGKGEAPLDRA